MKRRKALKQIGWGLSGGMLLPSLLDACGPKDPGPEVVYSGNVAIIGAGAAGLYAADILHTKGVKVTIFEARDQIGGRIRSLRNQSAVDYPEAAALSSDFPIELGAQNIIGSDSILGKIFQDYRLITTEFLSSENAYILDNIAKSDSDWSSDAEFIAAKNFRANLRNNGGSGQTVQQVIEASASITPRTYGMLNGLIGNAYGASNTLAGIGELAEEETLRSNDGKVLGLKTNPMQDVLISRFSAIQDFVKVNTPITSINHSAADMVMLTAKDGTTYDFNKVIVTVPVSVLKNGSMSFSPGLSGDFTGSLAKIGMGASMRVLIEFKKNFWGNTTSFIYGSSDVPEYFSAGVNRGEFNRTLSVTINGDLASQYSALGDGVVDKILADLDKAYQGQGTALIRQDGDTLKNIWVRQDWTKTDYILGGYSYPLPGATNNDRKNLGQSVNGKLFFAGEATDVSGQAGMVNGALASAERVVEEVVKAIQTPA